MCGLHVHTFPDLKRKEGENRHLKCLDEPGRIRTHDANITRFDAIFANPKQSHWMKENRVQCCGFLGPIKHFGTYELASSVFALLHCGDC